MHDLYRALAEKDLPAALAGALKLPRTSARSALEGVLRVWVARDPAGALAWVGTLPPGSQQQQARGDFFEWWTLRDPATAAAYLSAQGGRELAQRSDGLVYDLASSDPAAARRWLETLPPNLRRSGRSRLVAGWSNRDPRAAADYTLSRPAVDRSELIDDVLNNWANNDQAAALAWTEGLPPGDLRAAAWNKVCQTWAIKDSCACLAYLDGQGDTAAVADLRKECVDGWAESAPEDVWQWSRGLADLARRDEAGAIAAAKMAGVDPAKASALVGQLPAALQTPVASKIVAEWANTDLPAAQRWAANLPEGAARNDAWRGLVQSWAKIDAPAAAAWTAAQPAGAARDDGLAALLDADTELAPADALRLARTITDADTREHAIRQTALTWLDPGRRAATAWIQRARDLTDDQRANLLAAPEEAPPVSRTVVTP